jgi:hypothetical protein
MEYVADKFVSWSNFCQTLGKLLAQIWMTYKFLYRDQNCNLKYVFELDIGRVHIFPFNPIWTRVF